MLIGLGTFFVFANRLLTDGCLGLDFTHTGFTSEQILVGFEEVVSIRRC